MVAVSNRRFWSLKNPAKRGLTCRSTKCLLLWYRDSRPSILGSSKLLNTLTRRFTCSGVAFCRLLRKAASDNRSEKTTLLDNRATASKMPKNITSSNGQLDMSRRRAITYARCSRDKCCCSTQYDLEYASTRRFAVYQRGVDVGRKPQPRRPPERRLRSDKQM